MSLRFRPSVGAATLFALVALAAIVFGLHLGGEFVWDDYYLVEKSPLMNAASGWRGLLTTDLWEGAGYDLTRLYHPLPMLTLWAQVRVMGLSMVPLRLVNVGLHLANAWLFYRLLVRASIAPVIASALCLLFAVHPLAVEPAMWLTGRHDTLAVLLGLLGMHATAALANPRWQGAALVLVVTAAGAFATKEPYIVLPVLFGAHAVLVSRVGYARAALGAVAGFVGVGVVFLVRARLHIPSVGDLPRVPLSEHLQTYGTLAGVYGGYALSLSAGPTIRTYAPWGLPAALLVILAIAGALLASLWRGHRGSQTSARIAFGLIWFAVPLLPHVVSLPTLGVFANRYGYFPLLGALFTVGALLDRLLAGARVPLRRILVAALFVPILIVTPVSFAAASLWKSELDLFGADFAQEPNDPQSLYFLGTAIERKAGCEAALTYLRRASELAPGFARAAQNLAGCLLRTGRGAEAIAPAEQAVRLTPSTANVYNLALALEQAGRGEEAAAIAKSVLQSSPGETAFAELLARIEAKGR